MVSRYIPLLPPYPPTHSQQEPAQAEDTPLSSTIAAKKNRVASGPRLSPPAPSSDAEGGDALDLDPQEGQGQGSGGANNDTALDDSGAPSIVHSDANEDITEKPNATTKDPSDDAEGGNVGQVRRKVEQMTYAEGGVELELPPKGDQPDSATSAMSIVTEPEAVKGQEEEKEGVVAGEDTKQAKEEGTEEVVTGDVGVNEVGRVSQV